jgi:DNA-directed RNA polymerase subunit RPC12/RpoP
MSTFRHPRPFDCAHCGHATSVAAVRCPYCGSLVRVLPKGRGMFTQLIRELEGSTREAIELRILS